MDLFLLQLFTEYFQYYDGGQTVLESNRGDRSGAHCAFVTDRQTHRQTHGQTHGQTDRHTSHLSSILSLVNNRGRREIK